MSRAPQPRWMLRLKVGDVLVSARGTERVVRNVSRFKNGDLSCVTFAIRHCSWTGRCYTVLGYTDLNYCGYRPAGAVVKLRTKLDRHIQRCIENNEDRTLDCCDVKGVA